MKLAKIITLSVLLANPIFSFAQKAYKQVNYVGKVNKMPIKLSLADGYLPASEIILKTNHKAILIFIPETGMADEQGKLKFLNYINPAHPNKSYFVLHGLQENNNKTPLKIRGIYYDGFKQFKITLSKEKQK